MTHHMFNQGGHASSITPKTQTHASMHQRQSINEGLIGSNDRDRSLGMMGQPSVSSSVNGGQMFTRFSNIQLQNSLNKNNKIGG